MSKTRVMPRRGVISDFGVSKRHACGVNSGPSGCAPAQATQRKILSLMLSKQAPKGLFSLDDKKQFALFTFTAEKKSRNPKTDFGE
jgi:hypothetical protein